MFEVFVYYCNSYVDRLGPFDSRDQAEFVASAAYSSTVVVDVEICNL